MQPRAERGRVKQSESARFGIEMRRNDPKGPDTNGTWREHPDGSVVTPHGGGDHDLVDTERARDVFRSDIVRHQCREVLAELRLDIKRAQLDEPIELNVDVAAAADV